MTRGTLEGLLKQRRGPSGPFARTGRGGGRSGWGGPQAAEWAPQTVGGTVSTIFGRAGAVTAQTGDYSFGQISGTVGTTQLPTAGGDLSGNLSAPTVAKLQGRTMSATAPTSGQVLAWNGSQWAPSNAASGGVRAGFGRSGTVEAAPGGDSFSQRSGAVGRA